jgi:hypothetical protein
LFAGGCENNPDFPGANPTVYTNLCLQIKSKLLAGETGSELPRRILFYRTFPGVIVDERTLLPRRAAVSRRRACAFSQADWKM